MVGRALPPDPALGAALRRLRERDGRTVEALAHDAGITTGSLTRIELSQADPRWTTVRDIVRALGVSLADVARSVEHE